MNTALIDLSSIISILIENLPYAHIWTGDYTVSDPYIDKLNKVIESEHKTIYLDKPIKLFNNKNVIGYNFIMLNSEHIIFKIIHEVEQEVKFSFYSTFIIQNNANIHITIPNSIFYGIPDEPGERGPKGPVNDIVIHRDYSWINDLLKKGDES